MKMTGGQGAAAPDQTGKPKTDEPKPTCENSHGSLALMPIKSAKPASRAAPPPAAPRQRALEAIQQTVADCRLCPRLVAHREHEAAHPPKRFRGQTYWARPVPGWGVAGARLLIVGLAPAAHGGNRTGRIFTGDRSGDFLFEALHATGWANQPTSVARGDGLRLIDSYVAAAVRCAPPDNKPTPEEHRTCATYLLQELALLCDVRVVVALGKIAWDAYLKARREMGEPVPAPLPKFAHGAEAPLERGPVLLGTFHPSQQNTFTGRLTMPMLTAIFARARAIAQGR